MSEEWAPAPKGPPAWAGRQGKYATLYKWLNEHPGEWAVVKDTAPATGTTFRKLGYETINDYADYGGKNRADVYVRLPLNPQTD
jgi:hypothetical protein